MNKYSNIRKIFNNLFTTHLILNITSCLCSIASGYIAGNFLDSIAVSCNTLISPYISFSAGIASIIASGSEILCGKYMGTGDKKSINKVFTISVSLAVILGVTATIVSLVFSIPIISFFGAKDEILAPANIYFNAFSLGSITYLLMPALITFLHMENDGKSVTISVIILTVTYVLSGYLLIKVFNLSYFGLGLTNTISRISATLYLI